MKSMRMVVAGLVVGWLLAGACESRAGNGTWTSLVSSNWSVAGNWQNGIVAGGTGATAYFNTLDITANRAVYVDANATFGTLIVGDTTAPLKYYSFQTPSGTGTNTWTLDNGALSPVIYVGTGGAVLFKPTSAVTFNVTNSLALVKDGPGVLSFEGISFTSPTGGLYIKQGEVETYANPSYLPQGAITMGDGTTQVTLSGRPDKGGTVELGTRAITLNAGTQTLRAGAWSSGVISGVGALSIQPPAGFASAAVIGNANSTYAGGTTIGGNGTDKVILRLPANSTLSGGVVTKGPLGTGTVTLAGGGLGQYGGPYTLHNPVVIQQDADFQDGQAPYSTRNLTLAGPVTLSGGSRTLTISIWCTNGAGKATIAGPIGDGGNGYGLTVKSGRNPTQDVLELTGTNTYTGPTVVQSGILRLSGGGSITSSPSITVTGALDVAGVSGGFAVAAGQTLGGTGVVTGAVNVAASGILKPGPGGATRGTLTFRNNLDLAPGARIEIGLGPASGDCDKIAAGGALDLEGAVLKLSSAAKLAVGNTYTVISGSAPATGKFASVESGANAVLINYKAGAGNDVAVTIIPRGAVISIR